MTSFQRKILSGLAALLFGFIGSAGAQVRLGIDVLQGENFAILQGKRVGLITNQTGINSEGKKTRLILARAPGVKLVALFTPEHGLDGTEQAGRYVASRRDKATGLIAHSLYGPTRKPSPGMLAGIDVLVYDMQDIGSRSYTYVSTMVKCMEAAGELGIEFVVLDRPNPLGGVRVEGPPIESRWISFVGQLPVPYLHGMTVGELARMANALGWVQPRCKLQVVPMRGWQRQMTWVETGLRWIPTSPNIPHATSPLYYAATGIVGELAGLEIGCGGPAPFEIIAMKRLNAQRFTSYLGSQRMPGVSFSEYARDGFEGSRIHIEPHAEANLTAINVCILAGITRSGEPDLFARSHGDKLGMFYKCYGSDSIRAQIERGLPVSRIVAGWAPNLARFETARKSYLLY